MLLIEDLLKFDKLFPDSLKQCFLRLEHADSMQSVLTEAFPTPALRIGCLVRMTYKSFKRRLMALEQLNKMCKINSEVYAINYSSNKCTTTITRYLEPLFKHALDLQKAWSVDSAPNKDESEDNGVFDVNFHLMDTEGRTDDCRWDKPIFYIGSTDRSKSQQHVSTPIKERTGHTSPLTVHDVSEFFKNPAFYGDRNGGAQVHALPVVYVRHERDFICLSACTELKGGHVIFHLYYVWTEHLFGAMKELVANSNENEKLHVSGVHESRVHAYLKMLEDAKMCFWKAKTNTYIRLVMDQTRERQSFSRFLLHPLITQGITSSKVSLQSHIEGCRRATTGNIEMFPNAITIDCSKLVLDLDDGVSDFAASYKQNLRDAVAYANADGATGLPVNVLALRQQRVGNMLLQFKMERIAELAFDMAKEMYLGILDLYGVDEEPNTNMRFSPVSNYQFLRTLLNDSVYTSSSTFGHQLHTLLKNYNVEDDKLIPPPCASTEEGIHHAREDKEIYEFDIESAFPSIVVTFNISPETTVVMHKSDFEKLERHLSCSMISKEQGPFDLKRWCFVIPYTDNNKGDFVIVSLVPSVYKGFAAGIFTSLVLKRRTNKLILRLFYKRLANRIVGCMGQIGNDYAVQCLAAVSSICRTLITQTLDKLKALYSVKVLRTQTDGCLIQASRVSERLPEEIKRAFVESVNDLMDKNASDSRATHSLLRLKIRGVNVCFIAGQNKYAIRYSDDENVLKGHPAKSVPTRSAEVAVTETVFEVIDNISRAGYECRCEDVIAYFAESILQRMLYNDKRSEDVNDFYFIEITFPSKSRFVENKLLDKNHFKYDQHCRFGDTIPLWPVIRFDGDRLVRGYVHRPQRLQRFSVQGPRLVMDKFTVLRELINSWALELCRSQSNDFGVQIYNNTFRSKLTEVGEHYATVTGRSQANEGASTAWRVGNGIHTSD